MLNNSLRNLISSVWLLLEEKRKKQLFLLGVLTILGSLAEMLSLGMIIPFLSALVSPEEILLNENFLLLFEVFKISNSEDLILFISFLFVLLVIVSSIIRVYLVIIQNRTSMGIGSDLGISLYHNVINEDYLYHTSKNTSEIIAGLNKASGLSNYLIKPCLMLVSSGIMIISIVVALVIVNPWITFLLISALSLVYGIITFLVSRSLRFFGNKVAKESIDSIKTVQEGLGGIRDVILYHSENIQYLRYKKVFQSYMSSKASIQIIGATPKIAVESLGLLLLLFISVFLYYQNDSFLSFVPVLAAIALGAQRILPLLQQFYSALVEIRGNLQNANDALDLINTKKLKITSTESEENPIINFDKVIDFKDICFKYPKTSRWILKDLNFKIYKGEKVAILGETGAGKSTLLDILLGLFSPTNGFLCIDDQIINSSNVNSWQRKITHVPQSIFLLDQTIMENIAFGIATDEIDFNRVQDCAIKAQIHYDILEMEDSYNTVVGERGVKLSGGQRQRIAIARALYKGAEVLIFDEPTSAIDSFTESKILNIFKELSEDLTIIVITHSTRSFDFFDKIYYLENGQIESKNE